MPGSSARGLPGDRVRLDLDRRPRLTVPDRRVDALRGCVAVEYGPLVYCVEQADVPVGAELADVAVRHDVAPGSATGRRTSDAPAIRSRASSDRRSTRPAGRTTASDDDAGPGEGTRVPLTAVPYHRWANRGQGAMRVWIPTADG